LANGRSEFQERRNLSTSRITRMPEVLQPSWRVAPRQPRIAGISAKVASIAR
jgi:hypothetical protein